MTVHLHNLKRTISERPWYAGLYIIVVVGAAAIRFWDLGVRAVHHDESLHAFYSWKLYSGDGYIHNPMMHGPFQMEATAGLFFLFGDSDYTARLLYAIAGTALVLMPLLFRSRLGDWGALITSTLLAFSPAMLYYSRFARNDILMAVWTFGVVIAMWKYLNEDAVEPRDKTPSPLAAWTSGMAARVGRYFNENAGEPRDKTPSREPEDEEAAKCPLPQMGRTRYLYITAALLAFAFASKESAYLITATMGLYLVLVIASRHWSAVRSSVHVAVDSPPMAAVKIVRGWWSTFSRGLQMRGISKEAGFLVLLITITLPLWGAFVSIFQNTALLDWSGLTLASPVGGQGPIGAPIGGGLVVAFLVTALLIFLGLNYGLKWNTPVWWKAAAIFYVLFILMYTTFLTNPVGIGSGVWQAPGYWIVQQGEARGNQPWYYYTVLTTVYEFLPLLLAVGGSVYYLRNKNRFGLFLVYWVWTTFLLYTVASEKMPWLLVNITLPMIVLSGKFLNDILARVEWKNIPLPSVLLVLTGVPVFLALLWNLAFFGLDGRETIAGFPNVVLGAALIVVVLALSAAGYFLTRRIGPLAFGTIALVSIAGVLFVLSGRAGLMASFPHGDIPIEMMVYTQTSPDIHRLARKLREQEAREGLQIVAIDGTSGFHWPWYWYLRNREGIGYTTYGSTGKPTPPNAPVALVHSNNKSATDPTFTEVFSEPQLIKHRWWFPENVYRGYRDPEENTRAFDAYRLIVDLANRRAWRGFADYFLHRKLSTENGLCIPAEDDFSCLGSENAHIYQSPDNPTPFVPRYN